MEIGIWKCSSIDSTFLGSKITVDSDCIYTPTHDCTPRPVLTRSSLRVDTGN